MGLSNGNRKQLSIVHSPYARDGRVKPIIRNHYFYVHSRCAASCDTIRDFGIEAGLELP